MVWVRTDGKNAAADPVLAQQFQIDKTICLGEREKADLSGVTVSQGGIAGIVAAQNRANAADAVAKGCMAEKGYVQVPEDQAEAQRQQFADVAAMKQQQQTASRH
ncbi:MAG TPA: hypothetical protein VK430_00590 [Xanthobacteraceae bacterium]|nr:hypothetical protein [Xanthobacteraceae bacterium]